MAGIRPGFWDATRLDTAQLAPSTCTYKGAGDPKALIPVKDFIRYIELVETAYRTDTREDIVTRLRTMYYGGVEFSRLLPNPHDTEARPAHNSPVRARKLYRNEMDADAYDHLTAHADENGVGDNPSPYIVLPNCERVDVGHLLLGLDALLHPGAGEPFSTFNIDAIDPASWVGDVGPAVVWVEIHEKTGNPPPAGLPGLPAKLPADPDPEKYWQLSAPSEDILGDADAFGIFELFNASQEKLSVLLRKFYVDPYGKWKMRWQVFCANKDNHLKYHRTAPNANTIEWHFALRQDVINRVDRFNRLYAAGKVGVMSATLLSIIFPLKPASDKWKFTPVMVDKFLKWVQQGLENELNQTQPLF